MCVTNGPRRFPVVSDAVPFKLREDIAGSLTKSDDGINNTKELKAVTADSASELKPDHASIAAKAQIQDDIMPGAFEATSLAADITSLDNISSGIEVKDAPTESVEDAINETIDSLWKAATTSDVAGMAPIDSANVVKVEADSARSLANKSGKKSAAGIVHEQKPIKNLRGKLKKIPPYHDHSHDLDRVDPLSADLDIHAKRSRRQLAIRAAQAGSEVKVKDLPFPHKLHALLSQIEADGHADVVGWQPHGRAFVIRDHERFNSQILPTYFQMKKAASFQRQLNLYGFQRMMRGPDRGGYYHEYFLKGLYILANNIHRTRIKGTGVRQAADPKNEPNFYRFEPVSGCYIPQDKLTRSYLRSESEYVKCLNKMKTSSSAKKGGSKRSKSTTTRKQKGSSGQAKVQAKVEGHTSAYPFADGSTTDSTAAVTKDAYASHTYIPFSEHDTPYQQQQSQNPLSLEHIVYQKIPPHLSAQATPCSTDSRVELKSIFERSPSRDEAPRTEKQIQEEYQEMLEQDYMYQSGYQAYLNVAAKSPARQVTPSNSAIDDSVGVSSAAIDAVMEGVEPIALPTYTQQHNVNITRAPPPPPPIPSTIITTSTNSGNTIITATDSTITSVQSALKRLDSITSTEQIEKDALDVFIDEFEQDMADGYHDIDLEGIENDFELGYLLEKAIADI